MGHAEQLCRVQRLQVLHFHQETCLHSIIITSYQILPGKIVENYVKQYLRQRELSPKRPNINWQLASRNKPRKDEIVPGFKSFVPEFVKLH